MTQRGSVFLFLCALTLASLSAAASGAPSTKPHRLTSGRTIKVISIGPLFAKFGKAIALSYQTDLGISDKEKLREEINEIWIDFRNDAEREKVDTAVIVANEVPSGGFISTNRSFNFVFVRKPETGWAEASCRVDGGTIVRHGLYGIDTPSILEAPGTTSGKRHSGKASKWVSATDTVSRTKGVFFGYEFIVNGEPKGALIEVKVVVEHPPFTVPGSSEKPARQTWVQPALLGFPVMVGYVFDEEWEMVPGKWTTRVYHGTRLLVERDFTVE